MHQDDRPGKAEPEQIEVVLTLHADKVIMGRYPLPLPR